MDSTKWDVESVRRKTRVVLTVRRKILILKFKKKWVNTKNWENYKRGLNTKLHDYLKEKDGEVTLADVNRWVKNHPWITNRTTKPKGISGKVMKQHNDLLFSSSSESSSSSSASEVSVIDVWATANSLQTGFSSSPSDSNSPSDAQGLRTSQRARDPLSEDDMPPPVLTPQPPILQPMMPFPPYSTFPSPPPSGEMNKCRVTLERISLNDRPENVYEQQQQVQGRLSESLKKSILRRVQSEPDTSGVNSVDEVLPNPSDEGKQIESNTSARLPQEFAQQNLSFNENTEADSTDHDMNEPPITSTTQPDTITSRFVIDRDMFQNAQLDVTPTGQVPISICYSDADGVYLAIGRNSNSSDYTSDYYSPPRVAISRVEGNYAMPPAGNVPWQTTQPNPFGKAADGQHCNNYIPTPGNQNGGHCQHQVNPGTLPPRPPQTNFGNSHPQYAPAAGDVPTFTTNPNSHPSTNQKKFRNRKKKTANVNRVRKVNMLAAEMAEVARTSFRPKHGPRIPIPSAVKISIIERIVLFMIKMFRTLQKPDIIPTLEHYLNVTKRTIRSNYGPDHHIVFRQAYPPKMEYVYPDIIEGDTDILPCS